MKSGRLLNTLLLGVFSFFAESTTITSPGAAQSTSTPDTIQGSSIGSHPARSNKTTIGCLVEVPVLNVWTWQPLYLTADQKTETTTTPIPTDSAGTHISAIAVTTGAYRQNGTWTALTSLTTLTYPTGYTNIPNDWHVYPTKGTQTGFGTWMKMRTAILYTPTTTTTTESPAPTDPKGLQYILYPITQAAGREEIRWIKSVYADVSWIQECQATVMYDPLGKPPIAEQITRLAQPSITSAKAAQVSDVTPVMRTLETAVEIGMTSHTAETHSQPAKTTPSISKVRPHHGQSPSVTTGGYVQSTNVEQTSTSSSMAARKSGGSKPKPTHHNGKPTTAPQPSHRPHSSPQHSPTSILYDIPGLSTSRGKLVIEGQTLATTATATVGSGSVITFLALSTDESGDTIILDATLTRSIGTRTRETVFSHVTSNSVRPSIPSPTATTTSRLPGPSASTTVEANRAVSRFDLGLQVGWLCGIVSVFAAGW